MSGTVTGTPLAAGTVSTVVVAADSAGGIVGRVMPYHVFAPTDGFQPVARRVVVDTFPARGQVAAGSAQTFAVAGIGGVPADAAGVVLGIVGTSSSGGSLTLGAAPGAQPDVSHLALPRDEEATNVVVQPVGSAGFTVWNVGAADYRIEVLGYFGATSDYHSVAPVRIADSRNGIGLTGTLAPNATVDLTVAGVGGVPMGVTEVIVDVTTTGSADGGRLDVHRKGGSAYGGPTMDFGASDRVQTAVVPVSSGGITVWNKSDSTATHVVVDVIGYFA
jgi:hypothetical protein